MKVYCKSGKVNGRKEAIAQCSDIISIHKSCRLARVSAKHLILLLKESDLYGEGIKVFKG